MITSLRAVTENQIRSCLGLSDDEFQKLRNPAPEHMHDPELYSDMDRFVSYLKEEKLRQARDPRKIIAVFGDYDTDGVCASGALSASLAVLGFRYMVGIPTMEEGYGINPSAVDRMMALAQKEGCKIDMIITADNGIAAYDGIAYAASKGITVLVTDHHPAGKTLPQGAMVCIDPWKKDDNYPFKYNSGATVAWKVMLQYAKSYDEEKLPLIQRLIVLAGISNVGDIMPVTDENRYMVVTAIKALDKLRHEYDYKKMADTKYPAYNVIFWGLHDLIHLLQESKDAKRMREGKKRKPLPDHEELISWYLAPMLNAPRRVHGTCLEAMSALMVSDHKTRQDIIRKLIELNEMKTQFRDKVLDAVKPIKTQNPVICVNTRHGISGLVAGRLSENREMPSIVFAKRDDNMEEVIYEEVPKEGVLVASARSTELCPLNRVIAEVNRIYPGMIRGGGHATAAGITIDAKDYGSLREILPEICNRIIGENKALSVVAAENKVRIIYKGNLSIEFSRVVDGILTTQTEFLDPKMFASDVTETYYFLESLRPFGDGFEANTKFEFVFDRSIASEGWDPGFWKTFKFNLFGVECLTFDEEWGNKVKKFIDTETSNKEEMKASAKISLNTFRRKTTPQLQLSPL